MATNDNHDAGLVPNGDELDRLVKQGIQPDTLTPELPDHTADELLSLYREQQLAGKLISRETLERCYLRFRETFGPELLRRLDGEQLLTAIHGRGTKNSLVYWLEFKNDDELPAVFGSISGGNPLKFGIFQRGDSGDWITGSPRSQHVVTIRDAIAIVRRQRDQLVAGVEVLSEFAEDPEGADYAEIQRRLMAAAPDLADNAWGHKYFSLLFPQLLDDYHALHYQEFHLVKLLKMPMNGRYENARLFAAVARQLGLPMNHLTSLLNLRHGTPCSYWRVELDAEHGDAEWARMRDAGFVSIGYGEIGDLHAIEPSSAGRDHVRKLLEQHSPDTPDVEKRRLSNEIYWFARKIEPPDVVVLAQGSTILGVGEISGPYFFQDKDGPRAHRRPVRWHSAEQWTLPAAEAQRRMVGRLRRSANQLEIERRLSGSDAINETGQRHAAAVSSMPPKPLSGVSARIAAALERKGQVILYGPPGTGKTFWAERAVRELAARSWFGQSHVDLTHEQQQSISGEGAIEQCCFHPGYGYEDFLVGYRPVVESGILAFKTRKGLFARLCDRAARQPGRKFFLLIDEINRGDIPRIFGELLTVLEKERRGQPISLPLVEEPLIVPPNLQLVGTMNTADRSIALLDAALRRRFAFIELMPDSTTLGRVSVGGIPLAPWLDELNHRIVTFAGRDARNLQIGHSFLLNGSGQPIEDRGRFAEILRDDIIPLVQEYCYEDFDALEKILGSRIVDRQQKRINEELFQHARRADLFEAVLMCFEGITASPGALSLESSLEESDDGDLPSDESELDEQP